MYKITSSGISPNSTLLANSVISYLNTSYMILDFSAKKKKKLKYHILWSDKQVWAIFSLKKMLYGKWLLLALKRTPGYTLTLFTP